MNSSPTAEPPRKPKKKITAALVTAAQVILVLAILWLIWGKLSKAVEQIQSSDYQFDLQWGWIALGGLFYGISLLFPPMYWHSVLRQLGQRPTFYASMRAHIIGHLGKYIPGKIFVVLIRSGLLRGPGVDTTVCVLSIFLEGLLQMAVGALVVAALVVGWSIQTGDQNLLLGSFLLFCLVGIPIFPPVFKFGVKLIGVRKFSNEVQKVDLLSWRTFLFGIPIMLCYWLLLGASYWCTLRGVGLDFPLHAGYPLALLAMTASMVAGFVIVVAPGGMGVREGIIVMLITSALSPYTATPEAAALVSACVLRILWIAVEIVMGTAFYCVKEKTKD
ncbi:MAG: UPF0104 family protein [Thermoguttaceae bacterium]|nr:UPF0104 family protein [Thermoguttaceae bacterium]